MSNTKAPLCGYDGCRNPTWDGLCYLHVGAQQSGGFATSPGAPTLNARIPRIPFVQAWADASSVFTDIDDMVGVDSIREQVRATIRASVSLEAYRNFQHIDVADASERDRLALSLRNTITERLRPDAISIDRNDAVDLVHSSSDEFGRSAEDSAGLISYGLVKEWQMGQESDQAFAPDGTPYANSADDFMTVVSTGEVERLIADQFGRELYRFDEIVAETTGRQSAKNQGPFHPDLVGKEEETRLESAYYAEERARQESALRIGAEVQQRARAAEEAERARRERNSGIARGIATFAGTMALNAALDTDGSRAAKRERKAEKAQNERLDHLMTTLQRNADETAQRRRR